MKTIVSGYNPYAEDTIINSRDMRDLDGVKLHTLDLFIIGIESKADIDLIMDQLRIIREGFIRTNNKT